MSPIVIALAASILIAQPAGAQQVFKCTDNGKTVFSDHPCGDSARCSASKSASAIRAG